MHLSFILSTATGFLLRKNPIPTYRRRKEITALKGAMLSKSAVLCALHVMYFSLSHPFTIVYCPVLIVSKNTSCLTYMYLFKYWFSCVTETLETQVSFSKVNEELYSSTTGFPRKSHHF